MTEFTRDFTVAVFVIHNDHVILHIHQKLQRWLPPGGHIEPNELPDDAAIREVLEETGVAIELVSPRAPIADYPGNLASWYDRKESNWKRSDRVTSISISSISPARVVWLRMHRYQHSLMVCDGSLPPSSIDST